MRKFENFCNAYKNLNDIYDYHEPYSNVVKTGLVGLFELCFEQAWKAMKEVLSEHGYSDSSTGSPKMIIKTAYAAGMISDENSWLAALKSRNETANSYNEKVAPDIIEKTKNCYVNLFKELKDEIENRWI